MRLIISLAILALMLISCVTKDIHFATIKGHFKGDLKGKEIHLCKVEHGSKRKVATTLASEDGDFGFSYAVDESGLYVVNIVGEVTERNVIQDHDLKRFYLEKGTELEIELQEGSYKLLSSNDDKNKLLSQWNNQVDTVFTYSHGFMYRPSIYTDFFPLLPGYVQQMEDFKSKLNSGDSNFDELLKLMVETDMAASALRMIYTPRRVHPKREDYPDYYNVISTQQAPQSERLLELANGMSYTSAHAMYTVESLAQKPAKGEFLNKSIECIPNQLLKGYLALNSVRSFKAYDSKYLAFKAMINPYLKNDYLKEKFEAFELTIRTFEEGAPALDFKGKDTQGKEHKLSDYKGNLVYVDVWATWCGPCKAEIPALKDLEKKYHGKPITFLSISLDKQKDHKKWSNFVEEKALKGVQLIVDAAFDSQVVKAYGINSIPRFMLFDKKGNIISTNAPRPSDKKIEGLLNKHL